MGMGAYDDEEQQRKDQKTGEVNYEEDSELNQERKDGEVEFEFGDASVEELLDQSEELEDNEDDELVTDGGYTQEVSGVYREALQNISGEGYAEILD